MNTKSHALCIAALLVGLTAPAFAAFEPLPLQPPPAPPDNPPTAAKTALGKQLFFDPRLSVDNTLSCNSCHDVTGNGTESSSVSTGVGGQHGSRSAPTVWNAAFLSAMFWDGRAKSLEEQAQGPILNPIEMGMPHKEATVERIRSIPGYRKQFAEVFGGTEPVTMTNIAKAIATYERTLITPNGLFDQYLRGDKSAMSDEALAGMHEFENLGCVRCHTGPAFAGPRNMPRGDAFVEWFPAFSSRYDKEFHLKDDLGINQGMLPRPHAGRWRVPSLRNVALTAPYFHNGSVKTLNQAVRVMAKVQRNIELTDEQAARLVAFLTTLTGQFTVQNPPELPPDPDTGEKTK
ncbi:MAG: c-type cytochrome [Gammaproteobacteria bacterium]|nr:c-type cytochrome [Gammaproteobacteria bacterium]